MRGGGDEPQQPAKTIEKTSLLMLTPLDELVKF